MAVKISNDLTLAAVVPADILRLDLTVVPQDAGVYLWFIKGGREILRSSHYFETGGPEPIAFNGRELMYVGSAYDLRFRLAEHLRNPRHENSSPRKSLIAIEKIFGAVTASVGSNLDVTTADGLTEWIRDNVAFGFEQDSEPLAREAALISSITCPFNIVGRRRHKYSRWLMAWRASAFPPKWLTLVPGLSGQQYHLVNFRG
jgi:hypothetical protein